MTPHRVPNDRPLDLGRAHHGGALQHHSWSHRCCRHAGRCWEHRNRRPVGAADGEAGSNVRRSHGGMPNGDTELRRRGDHWEHLRCIIAWVEDFSTGTARSTRLPRDERFQRVILRVDAFDGHLAHVVPDRGQFEARHAAPVGGADGDVLRLTGGNRLCHPHTEAHLPCQHAFAASQHAAAVLARRLPGDAHGHLLRHEQRHVQE